MSVLEELRWRGLVYDASEGIEDHLASGPVTTYIGFDPTAKSLHVGSLLPMLVLARMQRAGHHSIGLVGGGTGMIGDPSGKSKERQLLTPEILAENLAGIRDQLASVLDFDRATNPARLVDNGEWLCSVKLIDFLRDIGKHFGVGAMLARESVRRRLDGDGISFTEFSYQLLQSWDFLVLNERYGCTLQMGGSDQWGNITAGTDLIRKMGGTKSYGLVMPLVTTSAGHKFGKTESGAVWLDPSLTSPYRFYQFWYNTADQDVLRYLKYFTFLDRAAIETLGQAVADAPQRREAQRHLAREVTTMIHGSEATTRAEHSAQVLFDGDLADLTTEAILEIFDDVPSSAVDVTDFDGDGMGLLELLVLCGLQPSKGAARRLVRDGGAYVNNRRVGDEAARLRRDDLLGGRVLVLRQGAKKYHLVTVRG